MAFMPGTLFGGRSRTGATERTAMTPAAGSRVAKSVSAWMAVVASDSRAEMEGRERAVCRAV